MSRNNIFWFFFGFSVYPLGGLEIMKKLEFSHFCQNLDIFGLFNQYNHEKSTKIKVILEMCVVKFKKSTNTPGGNQFSEHHGGLNSKILSKKRPKNQFFTILTPWNMPNMHKKPFETNLNTLRMKWIQYKYRSTTFVYTAGGQIRLFWWKMTQNNGVLIITPKF